MDNDINVTAEPEVLITSMSDAPPTEGGGGGEWSDEPIVKTITFKSSTGSNLGKVRIKLVNGTASLEVAPYNGTGYGEYAPVPLTADVSTLIASALTNYYTKSETDAGLEALLSGKVDKLTSGSYPRVYAVKADGTPTSYEVRDAVWGGLPLKDGSGRMQCGAPSTNNHCVNLKYFNDNAAKATDTYTKTEVLDLLSGKMSVPSQLPSNNWLFSIDSTGAFKEVLAGSNISFGINDDKFTISSSGGGGGSGGPPVLMVWTYNEDSPFYGSGTVEDSPALDPSKPYVMISIGRDYQMGSADAAYYWDPVHSYWSSMYGSYNDFPGIYSYAYDGNMYCHPEGLYAHSLTILMEADHVSEVAPYCFIEGTLMTCQNPETGELFEKPIEEIVPGDYLATWAIGKSAVISSRVLAPSVVGECTEFDRLYFSNGTSVDVYGDQLFWLIDTDRMVDWKKMRAGDRVVDTNGWIHEFVRSEHMVPNKPVLHYEPICYFQKYIVNGIIAGDKRDLLYPRIHNAENMQYWDALADNEKAFILKAWREGFARRNWKSSELYKQEVSPILENIGHQQNIRMAAKRYLDETDKKYNQYVEEDITEEEWLVYKAERATQRTIARDAEEAIEQLEALKKVKEAEVRAEIMGTFKPKYAGVFVGKPRAILEPEVSNDAQN